MGHSPEFAADENRLRWSSGSVVPSYNLMFTSNLNSRSENSIILRVKRVFTASLNGLFRSASATSFPVTTVRSSTSSKLRRIGDTLPRPLCSFNSDLRADRCPSIYSLADGEASTRGVSTLTSRGPPAVVPETFLEIPASSSSHLGEVSESDSARVPRVPENYETDALSCLGDVPEELSGVHDTFHVSNLKKCLADASLHVPLDEIKVDKTLRFVEEPVEIMDREVKSLKRSKIALVKVRWNSKRGPEFT
ncbi:hypothetical protein Tco_1098180 [Tanacetum coccineum]